MIKHTFYIGYNYFNSDGKYDLDFKNKSSTKDLSQTISTEALTDLYKEFIKEFPIVSIEDPFDQDHWAAWSALTGSTDIQVLIIIINIKCIATLDFSVLVSCQYLYKI